VAYRTTLTENSLRLTVTRWWRVEETFVVVVHDLAISTMYPITVIVNVPFYLFT